MKNELDKACFAHDAAYFDSKDLAKRNISNNVLKDRVYEIAMNPNYDGYQRELAWSIWSITFLTRKHDWEQKQVSLKRQLKNYINRWLKN